MNGKNGDDDRRLANYCEKVLDLKNARLSTEYFYQSLSLCVIDAVFSLGVKYEGTRRTVISYCDYFNLQRIRKDRETLPLKEEQESIQSFVGKMHSLGIEKFAQEIFDNRQRTSTKSGILKTEAVLRFASVLRKFGVNYFQDIPKVFPDEKFEKEVMSIPGQTSGLSLGYFFMLSGSDNFIKPDRMVLRFLEAALERRVSSGEAQELVTKAVSHLRSSYPNLTPRLLDNEMWKFQRGITVNKAPISTTIDPKQSVSFEELLMSQVISQEALTRLLVEKGIFAKEEFLEMVKVVDQEIKKKRKVGDSGGKHSR